ncbi:MAG: translation initiation factor IF-2 [Rickettsiaceae bacterium]|nr:translation initiation factor IF-2 [Rickettsiaceae bacterium]
MTDEQGQQEKPKKLTLSNNKLTLSRPVDAASLRKTYISGKANTVTVEVKKGQVGQTSSLLASNALSSDSGAKDNVDSNVSSKLNLLKRAAEDAKLREIEQERRSNTQTEIEKLEEQKSQAKQQINQVDEVVATEASSIKELSKILKPAQKYSENTEVEDAPVKEVERVPAKVKWSEPKKLRKNDIFGMLASDEDENPRSRTRSLASIKRAREKEKRKLQVKQDKIYREVVIPELITVGELANRMSERVADVIKELMKLGMIANANQNIDADTAEIIVATMGHSAKRVQESDVENLVDQEPDSEDNLKSRAPVVTVMGHVDHGKTSLLDALKSTDIAANEAGGITQHIGAYRVNLDSGKSITFIDTPGHEAFTEMRIRGAKITDIVVLVVAADDGIMAQTIEAISHAKAANVPIIVAINKIDKPDANIEKVKNELLSHNLVPEEYGGDIIIVPVSATKKTNIDKLEEAILLVAEMANLRSNPVAQASGAVIESRIDKTRGVIATLLVTRGSLRNGDIIVAGTSYGRVKRMNDDKGHNITECSPSMPAEVWGLGASPLAGEAFSVVQTEKQARDIAEYRIKKALDKKNDQIKKSSLEEMFLKATGEGGIKELPIVIKADVQGSLEAIASSINKITSDEVRIKIIHAAVGAISESDVALTSASKGIILGFNVRAPGNVAIIAEKENVDLRYYSIIYNLIDDVKSIVVGMLSPIIREVYIGSVEIRQVFNITKVGKVAGSYVTHGTIKRGAGVRLLRDNIVIHEGKLKTLKRFKDDVKEVRENYECGIAFENYDDIREGDVVEVFELVEEKRGL